MRRLYRLIVRAIESLLITRLIGHHQRLHQLPWLQTLRGINIRRLLPVEVVETVDTKRAGYARASQGESNAPRSPKRRLMILNIQWTARSTLSRSHTMNSSPARKRPWLGVPMKR